MGVLIDTQSFIWLFEDNARLPISVKLFMDRSNNLVVSIASFWEITIKAGLGKLAIHGDIADVMDKAVSNGFEILPIKREHLVALASLEMFHRDPFDRIIIAQAIAENMPIVSSDDTFRQYPVNCIWK